MGEECLMPRLACPVAQYVYFYVCHGMFRLQTTMYLLAARALVQLQLACLHGGASCWQTSGASCWQTPKGMLPLLQAFNSCLQPSRPAFMPSVRSSTRRQPSQLAQEMAAAVSDMAQESSERQPRRRRNYLLDAKASLGERAVSAHRQYAAMHANTQGWLKAFIREEYSTTPEDPDYHERTLEVQAAMKHAKKHGDTPRTCDAIHGVRASMRKRLPGAGRPRGYIALMEELWHWFVDRISNIKGRITSKMILSQVEVIKADMRNFYHMQLEKGLQTEMPKLPATGDTHIVANFRSWYGVTWRTVNLRYKISHAKRMSRLVVFWSNIIKTRTLHAKCFGPDKLKFLGFDQKPLYFNSALDDKSLDLRGKSRVVVRECVAASRQRFSVMTTCGSWYVWGDPARPPPIAVMFRADGDGSRIRQALFPHENVCLQFAPKGSYRVEHVLEWLEWVLPLLVKPPPAPSVAEAAVEPVAEAAGEPVAAAAGEPVAEAAAAGAPPAAPPVAATAGEPVAEAAGELVAEAAGAGAPPVAPSPDARARPEDVVIVLDWFKPHLDQAVIDLCIRWAVALLWIGGGTTGDVQVGDTHKHGPYDKKFKSMETDDAAEQLQLRPHRLPVCSRNVVMNRAWDAWAELHHAQPERGYIQDGYLNALDETGDMQLRSELLPVWLEAKMPQRRQELIREVEHKWDTGEYSSWKDFWKEGFLLQYDDHDGIVEGLEGAPEEYVDDEDAAQAANAAELETDPEAEEEDDLAAAGSDPAEESLWHKLQTAPATDDPVAPAAGTASSSVAPATGRDPVAPAAAIASSSVAPAAEREPVAPAAVSTASSAPAAPSAPTEVSDRGPDAASAQGAIANKDTQLLQWLQDTQKQAAQRGELKLSEQMGRRIIAVIRSKREDPALLLWLRSQTVARENESARKRAEAIEEDAESKRLAKRLKIAQLEADTAKTMGLARRAEAAARVEEAKESRAAKKQQTEEDAANAEIRKHHYAAWLAETCLRWKPTDAHRSLLDAKVAQLRRDRCWHAEGPALPLWWAGACRRYSDVRADAPSTMWQGPLPAAQRTWASERMARRLFGGIPPSEAKTMHNAEYRLTTLLDAACPGYSTMLKSRYPASVLLTRHKRRVDDAFLEGAWRYSHYVGRELFPPGLFTWPPEDGWQGPAVPQASTLRAVAKAAGSAAKDAASAPMAPGPAAAAAAPSKPAPQAPGKPAGTRTKPAVANAAASTPVVPERAAAASAAARKPVPKETVPLPKPAVAKAAASTPAAAAPASSRSAPSGPRQRRLPATLASSEPAAASLAKKWAEPP